VIVCGGLGPTQDDITRDAIAEVMNVPLVRDESIVARIGEVFGARGREMPMSNLRQADVPEGASVIAQVRGTAPGLICPVGHKVVYAIPGVPHEMIEMAERAVIPDLQARAGTSAVILSRTLRSWGMSESKLAEVVAPRLLALDAVGANPTIAFLASGMEGIKVRITAKASTEDLALAMLDAEEAEVRALLGEAVFGVDDETMEHAVGTLLQARGLTLGLAESVTGGLVASRLVSVPGASGWLCGSVVAYDTAVKRDLLGVGEAPAVSEETAREMAAGARKVLGSDLGLAITGVAGPTPQDGVPIGTVWCALAGPGPSLEAVRMQLPGDRERIRQFAAISALDVLRRRMMEPAPA
jgi:nicotinamide-nucleotide amidase